MGLERGTYGIEYDKSQKNSSGKIWLLTFIIPVVVILLVLRGCLAGEREGVYRGDDTSRDDSEGEVERERPSIVAHFLKSWRGKPSGESSAGDETGKGYEVTESSGSRASKNNRSFEKARLDLEDIPDEVERLLLRVDELEDSDDLVSARMILQKLRLRPDAVVVRQLVEKRIGDINIALILSDKPMPGKLLHKIAAGDLVSRLTRKYKNTQEYILRVNKIERAERIRIGQELWVLANPVFELMIDKSDFKAVLLFNNRFFKVYTVGLGDPDSVPVGSYEVRSRKKSINSLSEEHYTVLMRASGNTPDLKDLNLSAAENESHLGMVSSEGGIMFSKAGAEELYVLLPAGAMVTIIE